MVNIVLAFIKKQANYTTVPVPLKPALSTRGLPHLQWNSGQVQLSMMKYIDTQPDSNTGHLCQDE